MIVGVLPQCLKITVRESPSKATVWLTLCRTVTCCATRMWPAFELWPFSLFLSENFMWPLMCVIRKHQSDNHLGFAEPFLSLPHRPREQISNYSLRVIRKASSCESIKSSIAYSLFHPSSICCGSSFYSLFWYSVTFFCVDSSLPRPPSNKTVLSHSPYLIPDCCYF